MHNATFIIDLNILLRSMLCSWFCILFFVIAVIDGVTRVKSDVGDLIIIDIID